MSPSQAAQRLLSLLDIPAGTGTVWPVTRGGQLALVVRLKPGVSLKRDALPASFDGYPVVLERGTEIPGQSLRFG